jgi:starch synthase
MKVLMVSSEVAPFAKTGGLADVLGALPAALARLGDEVAVVLPKYGTIAIPEARRVYHSMPLAVGTATFYAGIDEVQRDGVRYLFVDCPPLYLRDGIYGDGSGIFGDNQIRYAALTQAVIGITRYLFRADILHAHDWQSGLLPMWLKTAYTYDPVFLNTRTIFTIHNLGYQGNFGPLTLGQLGIDPTLYNPAGLEFYSQVSFMKSGITWADAVTTVSPTYAQEIQTPAHGFGMDGVLRDHAAKLSGILNGVDYSVWSPEADPHLPARYSAAALSGKLISKRAVLTEMGLPVNDTRPLLTIVSRFAEQKGLDLIGAIAGWLTEQDMALAVLGSGDPALEVMFNSLAANYPDKVAVRLGYNEGLSHRLEAGGDMFLMPSRYEPCGLNQIYSLRYGTPPVVRATGGLADTVDSTTGFPFTDFTAAAFQGAIADALAAYSNRTAWTDRMLRGMAKDFSWDASAQDYRDLYMAHSTVTEFA